MPEQNNGLTFTLENVVMTWQDGELVLVERINGHTERWTTEKATRGKVLEIYGLDKIQKV